jgi:hypothetical protein
VKQSSYDSNRRGARSEKLERNINRMGHEREINILSNREVVPLRRLKDLRRKLNGS